MKNYRRRAWLWGSGVTLVLVLGLLANYVGGIAIRGIENGRGEGGLIVLEPLVRGTFPVVRWKQVADEPNSRVVLTLRDANQSIEVGDGYLELERVNIHVPCTGFSGSTTILLETINEKGVKKLARWQTGVSLLDPGPDCL